MARIIVNCLRFEAYFLPSLVDQSDLQDAAVVMTDVLRASTTMVSALANGAAEIWPHASIESARKAAASLPDSLLCGERQGKIIDGFDCGNSPREFPSDVVGGKTVVHCTTNGTVALEKCREASRVFIGAFCNCSATVRALISQPRAAVLCAGTDSEVTGEDVLFAGAVGSGLLKALPELELNDQARIAITFFENALSRTKDQSDLSDLLKECRGGQPLMRLGFHQDIEFCGQIDSIPQVAELNINDWRIRLA